MDARDGVVLWEYYSFIKTGLDVTLIIIYCDEQLSRTALDSRLPAFSVAIFTLTENEDQNANLATIAE